MVTPETPLASSAALTARRISLPMSASDAQTSTRSCQDNTAAAAASAAASLASVDEIQVRSAASMSAALPQTTESG